jgi:hypothetical protein
MITIIGNNEPEILSIHNDPPAAYIRYGWECDARESVAGLKGAAADFSPNSPISSFYNDDTLTTLQLVC